jgi:hypothetical protein
LSNVLRIQYIYLRISDDKEGLELGVGRQQEDSLSLAHRLHCVVYDIYKDNDISASTRSRKTRLDYRCKGRDNHGMRLGCGKVFRDETALDEYVTGAVFERFDSPEVARVLAPKEDGERAATLSQQFTHDVATSGRSGKVTHVLDGQPVPYVARPYKTILLDGGTGRDHLGSLVALSQMFDLSSSAMKGTLSVLAESSELVKEIDIHDTRIDWVLDIDGHTVRSSGAQRFSSHINSLILLELAGVHARHHARVDPTFLLVDEILGVHDREQIAALERLQTAAEHAQIAIISHSPTVVEELSREWTLTALDHHRPSDIHVHSCPIDFEIETTTAPPTAFDPQ